MGLTPNTPSGLHSVYLQYGELDPEVTPSLLQEAREFAQAVVDLRILRLKAAEETLTNSWSQERWTEPCDGTAFECSLDICIRRADGSVSRTHTY